jgi:hypothetical protein
MSEVGGAAMKREKATLTVLQFLSRLRWIDGKPLDVEPYRRRLFTEALDTYENGRPRYNLVLSGRAKKNYKSTDLVLAALFCTVVRKAVQGNVGLIVANDADQAADDLDLAKKLIAINAPLAPSLRFFTASCGYAMVAAASASCPSVTWLAFMARVTVFSASTRFTVMTAGMFSKHCSLIRAALMR